MQFQMQHICLIQKRHGIISVLLKTWEKKGLSNSFTQMATPTLYIELSLVRTPNIHKHSLAVLAEKQLQGLFLGR